jgi:CRP-like cAMP-binding protein
MILKLNDTQARVADVFLMLYEGMTNLDPDQDSCEFHVTANDVAHWAGLTPEQARTVINQFATQRRLDLHKDKIVVTNIHDLQRLVSSRRREEE